jgi:dihydrofolate synthase/folylpolyglutamate synthase
VRTFEQAFDALKGLTNYETMVRPPYHVRAMNLPRTRKLLKALGDPQRAFPTLQVAGTKGKGTAATALAAMLGAAGYRAGLYTSPHLFHVRERIRVDAEWIPEREFVAGVRDVLAVVDPLRGTPGCPTFFEMMTALALLHFARRGADAAVLEVGLGGRLDSTSAIPHTASLVTQIGLDHTAILGGTRALIAAEKAGVARRHVPLVSGVPRGTAAGRAIEAVATEKGAPVLFAGRDFRIATGAPEYRDGRAATPVRVTLPDGARLALHPAVLGRALARDVGLAAVTLSLPRVRKKLTVGADAMAAGAATLRVPGRLEVVPGRPRLLVDGAHNPDSARVLADTIEDVLPSRRVVAVLGGGLDKGIPAIAAALERMDRSVRFVFTRPATHPRAADPETLASGRRNAAWAADLPAALAAARDLAGPGDLIVVSGSLYLAGEALELLGRASNGGR